MLLRGSTSGGRPGRYGQDGWAGKIAGQYGTSTGQKQQLFGRVDPFCLFAVLPMLTVAGFFLWAGIGIIGVILIILAILIVVVDSWSNRPIKRSQYRDDR